MRRTSIVTRTTVVFLILSGIFNLTSYSLDQMVVQQEDNIREITREVNLKKTELDTLRNSLNTLENLTYVSSRYFNNFISSLDNVDRIVQLFNPEAEAIDEIRVRFEQLYSDEDIIEISKIYQKYYHDLVLEINERVDETLKNFSYTFSSGAGYELIKDRADFQSILNLKKIPENILKDYNFEKVDSDETEEKNYDIYSNIYDKVGQLGYLKNRLNHLSNRIIQPYYVKLFSSYLNLLDRYSSSLGKKNYYILFSILSQILGITFFLLLFRSILINRGKK
jgi:hypothetical protein